MRPGARLQAAMDILGELGRTRRPATEVLRAWARGHRFAGSKDRAAIAEMVFGVCRRRAEFAFHMDTDDSRALVLAERALGAGLAVGDLATECSGEAHDAAPLSDAERAALARPPAADLPDTVRANMPAWVLPLFHAPPGREAEEWRLMSTRAPLDLRVNTLKIGPARALERLNEAIAPERAEPGQWSPWALRVQPSGGGRALNLDALDLYTSGRIEVQDEGSQLAVLLSGVRPGWQVLDLCAGAGGKTLALAAGMDNRGQIFACDVDEAKLAEAASRVQRAGARNVQIRTLAATGAPANESDPDLAGHENRMDLVFLDVPCSGSGAWRRQPDAKWRLEESWLARQLDIQARLLDRGARCVRPGGRLMYVTCSLLLVENSTQVMSFLQRNSGFSVLQAEEVWRSSLGRPAPDACTSSPDVGSWMSPARTGTDGFFVCVMKRAEQ